MFFDQGRSLNYIAGEQFRSVPRVCLMGVFTEPYRACTGICGCWRFRAAGLNLFERRLFKHSGDRDPKADDLASFLGRAGAVSQLVYRVETGFDSRAVFVHEQLRRQIHRNGVFLADIAHVRTAGDHHPLGRDGYFLDFREAFGLELGVYGFDIGEIRVGKPHETGPHIVVAQI